MPKREIVPEPIVTVIDDYDGKELHPDTPPERYRINGRTYDLYLSDESKNTVDDFLRNLLDGAEEVRDTYSPRASAGAVAQVSRSATATRSTISASGRE